MGEKKYIEKYELGRTIGGGTFGTVKHAVHTESGEAVAIKIINKDTVVKMNLEEQIKKEVSVMKAIRHPNVVELKKVLATPRQIFLVLEFVTGGELFDKIVEHGKFDEDRARHYFRQLISGVHYCHTNGICHRDLKPENLLLDMEKDIIKIADFGLSGLMSGSVSADDSKQNAEEDCSAVFSTTCGTPHYVAPEVLISQSGYDGYTADVWSCGVILYVLLTGFLPFDEKSMADLFRKIIRADVTYPKWFSPSAIELLELIFVADPAKRASIVDIQQSAFYKGHSSCRVSRAPSPIHCDQSDVDAAIPFVQDPWKEDATENDDASCRDPISLNAFDIIAMASKPAIQRMIESAHDDKSLSSNPSTQFTTATQPEVLLERVKEVLLRMGAQTRDFDRSFRAKVLVMTDRGALQIHCQIFKLDKLLFVLDTRRISGNIFSFHEFYTEFRSRMAELET